eukprot:TRINITY_DN1981_c3_g1_i2.p1 TRINITY_DN1981_c3_g1~~TRINITY_DN1981_c3_g1_i2.p1  ORF type:complete len:497 (+),score=99.62 TRINITY_DN1981_c3_g1_i2:116-1492(+)
MQSRYILLAFLLFAGLAMQLGIGGKDEGKTEQMVFVKEPVEKLTEKTPVTATPTPPLRTPAPTEKIPAVNEDGLITDPTHPDFVLSFSGIWQDRKTGQNASVVQTGNVVRAHQQCAHWSPAQGSVTPRQIMMLGLSGHISDEGRLIKWSNGEAWVKIAAGIPPKPTPQPGALTLPDSKERCPGKDPRVYTSKSVNPFYLCTHGVNDMVSGMFIRSGWWGDCCALIDNLEVLRKVFGIKTPTVVDVGGNIGTCSWVMAASGASVTAFEPVPANYQLFEASNKLNEPHYGNPVRLITKAAGQKPGNATIRSEAGNMGNSVIRTTSEGTVRDLTGGRRHGWAAETVIHVTTLDNEVKEHVHFMKMDCQGHEIEALLGGSNLMSNLGVDVIRSEFDTSFLTASGHRPEELLEILTKYDYLIYAGGELIDSSQFTAFTRKTSTVDIYAVKKGVIPDEYHKLFI